MAETSGFLVYGSEEVESNVTTNTTTNIQETTATGNGYLASTVNHYVGFWVGIPRKVDLVRADRRRCQPGHLLGGVVPCIVMKIDLRIDAVMVRPVIG